MIPLHSSTSCGIVSSTSLGFPTSDADAVAGTGHCLRAPRCLARNVLAPPGLCDVSCGAAALACVERVVLHALCLRAAWALAGETRRGDPEARFRGRFPGRRVGTGARRQAA